MINTIQELDAFVLSHERINIFGTGIVSDRVYEYFCKKNWKDKIHAYILTSPEQSSHNGIPVLSVAEAGRLCARVPCLVATGSAMHGEITEKLRQCGVESFYTMAGEVLSAARLFVSGRDEVAKEREFFSVMQERKRAGEAGYDILLLSVPYWDIYSPFSAVPSLMGALREDGCLARQVDLGIECYHTLLKNNWRSVASKLLSPEYYRDDVCAYAGNPYHSYEEYREDMWFLAGADFPWDEVQRGYDRMNDVQRGVLHDLLDRLLYVEGVGAGFDDSGSRIQQRVEASSWEILWETLLEEKNLRLFSSLPSIVGISATGVGQILVACKVASIIEKLAPETKLVLGGSAADLFMEGLYPHKEDIFCYFDYIVIGEGETAITRLCRYLRDGQGCLEDVPNLSYVSLQGEIKFTYPFLEQVEILPLADYSGLDLDLYMAPRRMLPYQASRGCHYGYCAFCNHNEKYRHNYRMKSAAKVAREMAILAETYGVCDFQFVDEAIRPDHFRAVVGEMEKNPVFGAVQWIYYSRVSREYDADILQRAVKCGCRMVMFGVETFNNRLLKFIRKGITAETSEYSLRLFHDAGILTFAWLMCNLPSETVDEVRGDIRVLEDLLGVVDVFSVGMFSLEANTDMYKDPEKFNITSVDMAHRTLFSSHHEGRTIDKSAMVECFRREYEPLMKKYFFLSNRYYAYFKPRS